MPRGDRSLKKVLGFLEALAQSDTLDEFAYRLSAGISDSVPCEIGSYNEIDPATKQARVVAFPLEAAFDGVQEQLATHMDKHPLINHFNRTGDGSAVQISDFVSRRQFRSTGLYHDVFKPVGVDQVMSVCFPTTPGPSWAALACLRSGSGYSDAERAILDLFRGNLTALHSLIRQRVRLELLEQALETGDRDVMIVDANGRILEATERARLRLNTFFELGPANGHLPADLTRYLVPGPGHQTRVSFRHTDTQLDITLVPGRKPDIHLLLLGLSSTVSPERLRSLGLTPREAEVLTWVAKGKSNAEIAELEYVSVRTVKKHLERIYEKLGVRSRTEAAVIALGNQSSDFSLQSSAVGPR